MQSPAVSRPSHGKTVAAHFILIPALLAALGTTAHAAPTPVTINFDNLGPGVPVSTQYSPQVIFSAPTGYYGSTLYTSQMSRSYPRGLVSYYNGCDPFDPCGTGDVYLTFPTPVTNFSFYILGGMSNWRLFFIDVYVSGGYYGTYEVYGNGQPVMLYDQLKSIPNITNVYIYYASNIDYYGYAHDLAYDDFSFTPNFDVNITSGRVNGFLNGLTKPAMLGADVALNASVTPPTLTGGTFSWSATGPKQQVTASSTGSSYTVRWTEPGTYQVEVTYSRNGFAASSTLNVNVTVPTLDSFTANQEPSLISGYGPPCAQEFGTAGQYTLGCADLGFPGITFSSTVQIPAGQYLSDLNQSGVKYVHRVSAFRKQLNGGITKCRTRRGLESDSASGWLLDASANTDAYDPRPTAVRRFSEGLSLTITTQDSPGERLEAPSLQGATESQHDALKVDDHFEMYVVYFTSTNSPLQRTVGKLPWNWGGVVVYDSVWVNTPYPFRLKSMFGGTGARTGASSSQAVTYQGRTDDPTFVMSACPGVTTPTLNPIDGTHFYVRQQYRDVLKREPEQSGWNYWRSHITACDFDAACIAGRRLLVAWGFFNSPEFRQTDPGLANPPGTPGFDPAVYNPAFVRQLYRTYLQREPEPEGMAYYLDRLNSDGNYDAVINGFINSPEYRSRFGPP